MWSSLNEIILFTHILYFCQNSSYIIAYFLFRKFLCDIIFVNFSTITEEYDVFFSGQIKKWSCIILNIRLFHSICVWYYKTMSLKEILNI